VKPRIKILLLAALVTLSALPALSAAPAEAGKRMEAALQDEGVFLFGQNYDRNTALAAARSMGITTLRMNILWWQAVPRAQQNQTSVPSDINYNFAVWDSAIAAAKRYGIKTQLDLTGDPPAWACGNKKVPYECDGYKPNVRLWKGFVKAAAKHFKGDVKRYSIWNEPNWYTWLSPHDEAPLLYRELYRAGYDAIKGVDPGAEVVMGELAPHFQKNISTPPLQFIREMVCVNKKLKRIKGAKKKCGTEPLKLDAFSTHPYDFTNKPTKRRKNPDELTMANIRRLPKLLNKLRKKGLIEPVKKRFPIYLTEFGYFVGGRRGVSETKRAQWIVQAWQLAQENRRVKQMIHYTLVSPPASSPSAYFDMGLIAQNGVRRASYFALQNWIQQAVAAGKLARPGPCSAC